MQHGEEGRAAVSSHRHVATLPPPVRFLGGLDKFSHCFRGTLCTVGKWNFLKQFSSVSEFCASLDILVLCTMCCCIFFFFCPHHVACGVLFPQPGIKRMHYELLFCNTMRNGIFCAISVNKGCHSDQWLQLPWLVSWWALRELKMERILAT